MDGIVVYTDTPWLLEKNGKLNPCLADIEREVFEPAGVKLKFGLVENGKFIMEGEKFLNNIKGASALAIYRTQITPELINKNKNTLRIIGRIGVGADNLNINLLKEHKIPSFSIPDYCISEVAAHTSSLILALERGLTYQDRLIKSNRWDIYEGNTPRRTEHLTLGILGLGRIGKAVAYRLKPFYKKIISYDPFVNADQMIGYGAEKVETLDQLAEESDVITIHCVLTKEKESESPTYQMLGDNFFNKMKKDAYIVNTARGAIVNKKALLKALKEKKIAGAGLDVFSPENPNDDKINKEIVKLDNVIASCHRAYLSNVTEKIRRKRVAENIVNYLKNNKLPFIGCVTDNKGEIKR